MANFDSIYFNENRLPDFVKVINIEHSILPPISQNLLTVGGKAGAYDFGNNMGTREINIDVVIVLDEPNTLPEKLELLAEWLYYDEPKELILGDNLNRYYVAKFTGDSNIKESFLVGEGTLTFLCTDPFIKGAEIEKQIPTDLEEVYEVVNSGTAETYPKMSFKIGRDLTGFTIASGDEFLEFGTPFTVDDNEADIVNYGGYVMKDSMTSLNGWTVAPSVYGGAVTGTFEVFGGYAFRQAGLDYGTGSGWHGASMMKNFSQDVQNFQADMYFRINAYAKAGFIGTILMKVDTKLRSGASTKFAVKATAKKGQTYKVQSRTSNGYYKLSNGLYCPASPAYSTFTPENVGANRLGKVLFEIKDTNGSPLVRLMMYDATARSRSLVSEVVLVNGSQTKTLAKRTIPSAWHDCRGYYHIVRNGRTWSLKLYFWNGQRYSLHYYVKWLDGKKNFYRKAKTVQIATQAYSTNDPVYMEVRDVFVKTLDSSLESNKIPLIMRVGDVLDIDNETGAILLNNRPFYQYLNPSSTFIKLGKGSNGLAFLPADGYSEATISYTERYL